MMDWKKICVDADVTILEVMKLIEQASSQICLVVDPQLRLLGTVTDGDVRRGLLKGIVIHDRVNKIMNPNPLTAIETVSDQVLLSLMKTKMLTRIPLVNNQGVLVGLRRIEDIIEVSATKKNPVVLMAGGLGSRLGALTHDCPKPMLKVGNKPLLEVILEHFISQGFHQFFISVNYMSQMIEDYFGNGTKWGVQIKYLKETQKLGTAGSLSLLAQSEIQDPLIVMNGDLLTKVNFSKLLEHHQQHGFMATMGVRQYDVQVPYGVVELNDGKISQILEKPVHSFFVSAGVNVLDPKVLSMVKEEHLDMPELFHRLIARKESTGVFPIHEYWLDIGQRDDFEKAKSDYSGVFE